MTPCGLGCMARKVVPMETRLKVALAEGPPVGRSFAAWCGELGIAPKTAYKWRQRYRLGDGLDALVERSRRPARSPSRIEASVRARVVEIREELAGQGRNCGAQAIVWHLQRLGEQAPARTTVHRILVAAGLVIAQPAKRPNTATKRFEYRAPNACWQIDATQWRTRHDGSVWIFDVLDDHSRRMTASHAASAQSAPAAWTAFTRGVSNVGCPQQVLHDNHLCFTGRLHGIVVPFEANLRTLGVRQVCSSPNHPQTCGKNERVHATRHRWLAHQTPAATIEELQDQLDTFDDIYNTTPHHALAGMTPLERWHATPAASAPTNPLPTPWTVAHRTVDHRGAVTIQRNLAIHIGAEWAGHHVDAFRHDLDTWIFTTTGHLIRKLTIDPTRTWQPSGLPQGRAGQQRVHHALLSPMS